MPHQEKNKKKQVIPHPQCAQHAGKQNTQAWTHSSWLINSLSTVMPCDHLKSRAVGYFLTICVQVTIPVRARGKSAWETVKGFCYPHLGLFTGLAVCAVWLIVQLLRDHAEELSLILISIVVRRADTNQLPGERKGKHMTTVFP